MKRTLRYLSYFVALIVLFAASSAIATTTAEYLIIKDLPFVKDSVDFRSYVSGVFQLGLGVAITLSVVMLVINGIQYSFSDLPGIKTADKNRMGTIVLWFFFGTGSWLILYTINPNYIEFDFITSLEEAATEAGKYVPPAPPSNTGAPWPDDTTERAALQAGGISINTATCKTVGQKGCTSVHGLSQSAIEKLINIKRACKCNLTVTGGTEYWLHKTHNNNSTVDLRSAAGLTAWIGGQGSKCFDPKTKGGFTFYWEDNRCGPGVQSHWHVSL